MPLTRTIFTTSQATIDGRDLLTQNFDVNKSIPHETINEMGRQDYLLETNDPITYVGNLNYYPTGADGAFLQNLKNQSESSAPARHTINSNLNSIGHALTTSIKINAAVGSVPQIGLSFLGGYAANVAEVTSSSAAITTVKTTQDILFNSDIKAQQFSLSWDCPVVPVPTYTDTTVITGFFGNPPSNCSFDIRGLSQIGLIESVTLGSLQINFPSGKLLESGVNLAVGQLMATYNLKYQLPGTNVSFVDV